MPLPHGSCSYSMIYISKKNCKLFQIEGVFFLKKDHMYVLSAEDNISIIPLPPNVLTALYPISLRKYFGIALK